MSSPGKDETSVDLAGTAINAAVVAGVGLILGWLGRGQYRAFERRFDGIERRFEGIERRFEGIERRFEAMEHRMERLEERLEHRIDALQASVDAMRSDLTQVALAVGVRPRAGNE